MNSSFMETSVRELPEHLKQIEGRVNGLEQELKDQHTGWKAKFSTTALIVGFIGGSVGIIHTIYNMHQSISRTAQIAIGGDGPLEFRIQAEDAVSVKIVIGLTNYSNKSERLIRMGTWVDVLNEDSQVERDETGSNVSIEMPITKSSKLGASIASTPIPITPLEATAVAVTGVLPKLLKNDTYFPISRDLNFVLPRSGLYRIVIEIQTTSKPIAVNYCFWFDNASVESLKKTGILTYPRSDPRCENKNRRNL